MEFSMRWRNADGVWSDMNLDTLIGSTVEDVFLVCDGQEVVAELINGEKKGYLCGVEKHAEHYRKKGFPVYTFAQGIEMLRKKHSALLGEVVPVKMSEDVQGVFGEGCVVEKVSDDLFD